MVLQNGENGCDGATRTVATGEAAADFALREKLVPAADEDRLGISDLRLRGDISATEFRGLNIGSFDLGVFKLIREYELKFL